MKSKDERQEEARVKWIKNKCKGCLVFPTGVGKTYTAIKCLNSVISKYPKIRFLVIVPTDNLKIQWQEYIDNNGLSLNGEVVIVNTGIKNTYSTDILVIDELHRINSTCFRDIFKTVKYKYILGLTATYERLDNLHKEVAEKYCPVIDSISIEEALLNNWIAPFTEYAVLLDVDNIDEYSKMNKEFISHYEYFGYDFNLVMSLLGRTGFINRAKLRDKMCPNGTVEQRKQVFQQITYHATAFMRVLQGRKKFINNHPKKVEVARQIIENYPFSKIITFSNNVKMAESIGIGKVYTGKDSKSKARTTIEEFNKCSSGVINSVKKLNEGADLKGLSIAIMLGIDSSEIRATQTRGRAIRFEKGKHAYIFNLIINDTVEWEWFKKSHEHSPYKIIGEEGLMDVLSGKEPRPYKRKVKDFTLRY